MILTMMQPSKGRFRNQDSEHIHNRLKDLNLNPKPKVVSAVPADSLNDDDGEDLKKVRCNSLPASIFSRRGGERDDDDDNDGPSSAMPPVSSVPPQAPVEFGDDGDASVVPIEDASFWWTVYRHIRANRIGFFLLIAAPICLILGKVYNPVEFSHITWEAFVTVELTIMAMILMINDQPSDLVHR
jgi:hypothetical protein